MKKQIKTFYVPACKPYVFRRGAVSFPHEKRTFPAGET